MPASRSAAAMTRAPRSCPSSPGLPTSTRMRPWLAARGGRLAVSIPTSSELRRRLVCAELRLQHRSDLADGAVRGHGVADARLDVPAARRRLREPLQRGARRLPVPLALHPPHPLRRVERRLRRALLQLQVALAV